MAANQSRCFCLPMLLLLEAAAADQSRRSPSMPLIKLAGINIMTIFNLLHFEFLLHMMRS
jgi:hypothetical protein